MRWTPRRLTGPVIRRLCDFDHEILKEIVADMTTRLQSRIKIAKKDHACIDCGSVIFSGTEYFCWHRTTKDLAPFCMLCIRAGKIDTASRLYADRYGVRKR